MSNNAKTVAIANGKGGVGKSTLTFLLALYSTLRGKTVKVVDVDIQATALSALAAFHDGEQLLLASGSRGTNDEKEDTDEYTTDVIIYDLPAGPDIYEKPFWESLDILLVPCQSSEPDIDGTRQFLSYAARNRTGHPYLRRRPRAVLVPNLIDTGDDLRRVYFRLRQVERTGPIPRSKNIKHAMGRDRDDDAIRNALAETDSVLARIYQFLF